LEKKSTERIALIIVFAIALAVYTLTMCPTVMLSDAGELSTVCATLGVAHPTGYPLYTALGRVFVATMPFTTPVVATNFMSALFGALAAAAIFLTMREMKLSVPVAALCALAFAFGKTLWNESVGTEVYSLSAFLNWIAVLFLWKWHNGGNGKYFIAFAYFVGLSFANHLSIVLFLPAFVYIIVLQRKSLRLKSILIAASACALGLSIYLYLPIRAALDPAMNWGDPSTFARFFKHLSGWQYRVWMFSLSKADFARNIAAMWSTLGGNLTIAGMIAASIGLVATFIKGNARFATFLALITVFDLLYSQNYSIPDISPYYIPACGALACAFGGFDYFLKKVKYLALIVAIVSAGGIVAINFTHCDRSTDYTAAEYGANVLTSAQNRPLLIIGSWDMFAPANYLQKCENIRADATLIDFSLLRRSWYIEHLAKSGKFDYAKAEFANFLAEVKPFERGIGYNAAMLQLAFENMIVRLTTGWNGAVYCFATEDFLPRRFKAVPCGILLKLKDDGARSYIPPRLFDLASTVGRKPVWDERQKVVYSVYSKMFLSNAGRYYESGEIDRCIDNLEGELAIDPNDKNASQNLLTVLVQQKRYTQALSVLNRFPDHFGEQGAEIIRNDIVKKIQTAP
jgi:hypothetical protein